MNVIKVPKLPVVLTPKGLKYQTVVNIPEISILHLILQPGEQVPAHRTPVNVLFQVWEGKGTITVGEEKSEVEKGDFVFSPLQIPHALEADRGSAFSVLVMKVPNPQKPAER